MTYIHFFSKNCYIVCNVKNTLSAMSDTWRREVVQHGHLLTAHLQEQFREMVCTLTSLFSFSLWTSLRIRLQLVAGFPSVRRYSPSTSGKLKAF